MTNAIETIWRNCYKCGFEGTTTSYQCPKCGQRLRSAKEIRWLGGVLVVIGTFLAGAGGALLALAVYLITQAGKPGSNIKFSGRQNEGLGFILIFGVSALLMALGLTSIGGGAWQVFFGRRNKFFVYLFIILVVIFVIVGFAARFLLK